jgi:nitrate/nitrite-specific signal transduction histidine kinase
LSKLIGGVLIAPTLPIFIFISSLYNLILNDKEFAIFAAKSVRMQQMSLLKNQQELIKIHNLAGYVHNSLQPELLRISKHLEMTSASAAHVDLEGQLDALSIALSRSLEDVSALRETGLDRLQKVIEAWAGIAEISLEIPKFLELDPDKSILLVDLIEEMITNSIRLGKASEIKISILLIGASTKVKLAHNGSKIDLGGTGLGSQWIAQYSSEKPYLDNNQNRMTYTLSI